MPKYLITVRYEADGAKGLIKAGGTTRTEVIRSLIQGLGGTMEAFYYSFGEADAYLIVDVPEQSDALALSLAVNASGAVHSSATPLIPASEVDAAAKKVPAYRAPGA